MGKAEIIDGKKAATEIKAEVAQEVEQLKQEKGIEVGLAVILVGDDPASKVYVKNKIKACEAVGIKSYEQRLKGNATQKEVARVIDNLNHNSEIHGILLQLPLPDHLDADALIQKIAPQKDVDGLTIENAGKLFTGTGDGLIPCTPQGALHLIKTQTGDLSGMNAIIIGRSLLFGKPMAQLLLSENATVTQAHSRTKDLPFLCSNAEILVCAVGNPNMVKGNWIKKGAIVIDVGINRLDNGKLCGDVDFEDALEFAGSITPVPGGVGPMTIAFLMKNTLKAARLQTQK